MPIPRVPVQKEPDRIRNAIMNKVFEDSLTYRGPEHYVPMDRPELNRGVGDGPEIDQILRRNQPTIDPAAFSPPGINPFAGQNSAIQEVGEVVQFPWERVQRTNNLIRNLHATYGYDYPLPSSWLPPGGSAPVIQINPFARPRQ